MKSPLLITLALVVAISTVVLGCGHNSKETTDEVKEYVNEEYGFKLKIPTAMVNDTETWGWEDYTELFKMENVNGTFGINISPDFDPIVVLPGMNLPLKIEDIKGIESYTNAYAGVGGMVDFTYLYINKNWVEFSFSTQDPRVALMGLEGEEYTNAMKEIENELNVKEIRTYKDDILNSIELIK